MVSNTERTCYQGFKNQLEIKKKIRAVAIVLLLVFFAGVCTAVSRVQLKKLNVQSVENKSGAINFKAENNQERLKFISQFGWEVDSEPVEVNEVIIPQEFDDVYNNYNEIQLMQNCDLAVRKLLAVRRRERGGNLFPPHPPKKAVAI